MSININPSYFQNHSAAEHAAPQVHYSAKDLENLRKKETDISIKGDVFTYSGVSFKPMSQDELLNEKIDIRSLHLTSEITSDNPVDNRVTIAFRDPNDPKKIIAYKLDKKIVDNLKKSFSADNFFQRQDGIVRLNSKAEEYIAGWVSDIKENRGYDKADKNGNGIIDEGEQGDLNIGFDRQSDYDYLGEKIVAARTSVGERNYLKYSDTPDSHNAGDMLNNQALKFKNSIEKELSHTLDLDKDKDGTITLKEGLADFTPTEKSVEKNLVEKTKSFHDEWVIQSNIVLDQQNVATNEVPIMSIVTQQDKDEALKQFNEHAKQLREDTTIKKILEAQSKIDNPTSAQTDFTATPVTEVLKSDPTVPVSGSNDAAASISEVSKNTPATPADTTAQATDTINKNAYNYFDLGEDISPYTKTDPVQEQTNKELVHYLTGLMDDTTAEGKKNLVAFDTQSYGAFFSDEDIKEINARLFSGSESNQTGSFIVNPADLIKNAKPLPITHVADGYTHITLEESNKRETERFLNLYSFSDEFSKTKKFQELYDKYKVLADKQRETLIPLDDNFSVVLHTNDMKGYLTSEVVNKGFSKSEFIEHFSNISKDLKEIFSTHAETISTSRTQAIKESIKLYDKITADLKDMWGYGDLDVHG